MNGNGYRRILSALLLTASGAGLGAMAGLTLFTDAAFDLQDAIVGGVLLGIFAFASRVSLGASPLADIGEVVRQILSRKVEPPGGP